MVEVEASTIGQMLRRLEALHPALKPIIAAGVSVSVNGKIYAYGLTEQVGPKDEIYLIQRIKGG